MLKSWLETFTDAWTFVVDPDARVLSPLKYTSGAGMSVREAKRQQLM